MTASQELKLSQNEEVTCLQRLQQRRGDEKYSLTIWALRLETLGEERETMISN